MSDRFDASLFGATRVGTGMCTEQDRVSAIHLAMSGDVDRVGVGADEVSVGVLAGWAAGGAVIGQGADAELYALMQRAEIEIMGSPKRIPDEDPEDEADEPDDDDEDDDDDLDDDDLEDDDLDDEDEDDLDDDLDDLDDEFDEDLDEDLGDLEEEDEDEDEEP